MCDAAGVFASTWQTRAVGVLIGCLLDVVFGDPKRGHPVALFGRAAAKLEQITYRDGRVAWTGVRSRTSSGRPLPGISIWPSGPVNR